MLYFSDKALPDDWYCTQKKPPYGEEAFFVES
jgi:hypothetical protein